jgi:D-alanyl-D-alanine carboxypeptidase
MIQNGQYNYEYAIGGKTGYTDDAGFTCVTVAKKDGLTLIGVLLNNSDDTDRYDDMPKLFDYGFSNYSTLTYDMLDVEETILDFDDQIQTFKLNDNIHILVPVSQKNSILSHSLEMADVDDSEISKVIMNLFLDDVKITSLDLDKTIEYKEEVGIDTLSIGYDSDNIFLRIINWTSMLFLIGILFNIAKNKFIKENSK